MSNLDQIISVESGGNANARNPRSSAGGLGQFIDATWMDMVSRHRPDLAEGKSRDEILKLKFDPELSREMTGAYERDNSAFLAQRGFQATPGNTYLAHFAGPQGAASVLGADPSARVADILGPGVVKANPFLSNMTAGDLQAWSDRKMGGQPSRTSQPMAAYPWTPQPAAASQPEPAMAAYPWTPQTQPTGQPPQPSPMGQPSPPEAYEPMRLANLLKRRKKV